VVPPLPSRSDLTRAGAESDRRPPARSPAPVTEPPPDPKGRPPTRPGPDAAPAADTDELGRHIESFSRETGAAGVRVPVGGSIATRGSRAGSNTARYYGSYSNSAWGLPNGPLNLTNPHVLPRITDTGRPTVRLSRILTSSDRHRSAMAAKADNRTPCKWSRVLKSAHDVRVRSDDGADAGQIDRYVVLSDRCGDDRRWCRGNCALCCEIVPECENAAGSDDD
jgi:hypothetical protein